MASSETLKRCLTGYQEAVANLKTISAHVPSAAQGALLEIEKEEEKVRAICVKLRAQEIEAEGKAAAIPICLNPVRFGVAVGVQTTEVRIIMPGDTEK